ncbi:TlpA family protein disulfide reductase [Meiothermus sp. QL-1]|uniref:TlpA family protein disulfide reductase n=1 Tax=Meiothermus sp. QL-1 TaxID=2058095 RepID=UPI000E0AF651|nr:TlpA disulfide reductase family protein [Meiothermus sp. QL-1]RDI96714.1 TlpA family protein disulfide reductase [Meiothermus sp. QL-1]
MRGWLWWVPLALLLGWLLLQPRGSPGVETLPSFTLEARDGRRVNLTDYLGKPLVLNAWATWCGPCRREMPLLLRAAQSHPDHTFVFLNVSDGPVAVEAFEAELGLKIPNLLFDPQARLSEPLRLQGLPVTLFYDAQGRLLNRHLGEISEAELMRWLRP